MLLLIIVVPHVHVLSENVRPWIYLSSHNVVFNGFSKKFIYLSCADEKGMVKFELYVGSHKVDVRVTI